MGNKKRSTTDRWYGKVEDDRLNHLENTFEYIRTNTPTEESLTTRILETTNAESEKGVHQRLSFLESADLLEHSNNIYRLTERSQKFLETGDTSVIFEGLRSNVVGFDELLEAAADQPLTDGQCHEILTDRDGFDSSVGVAGRHREWLQMLGLIEESDDGSRYTLTEDGEAVYQQLRSQDQEDDDTAISFELNEQYRRQKLHDEYGGNRQSGISPTKDHPVIFVFTGHSGKKYGYDDEFLSDGTLKYTGAGREGDMDFTRSNKALRDHQDEENELHVFWKEGDGMVRYLGQFEYDGHDWTQLPDTNGDMRDAIRFSLTPVGEVVVPDDGDDGFERIDPSTRNTKNNSSGSSDRSPAVFMIRGYGDSFHRNVARSLANYLTESKRTELQQIIKHYQQNQDPEFDTNSILDLLESETVTAWGTKNKTANVELFKQMRPGDRFIMRTGQPNEVRFIQNVDLLLGEEIPLELRREISECIWTSTDYEYIWFSEDQVADIHCPQEDFEGIVREAVDGFEIEDWFHTRGKNFIRIDDDVLADLGGQAEFSKRLTEEFDGERRDPGVENYFLLNADEDCTEFTEDQFFNVKKAAVDNWKKLRDAENNAEVIVHSGDTILGYGRIGNIEGKRQDGNIYKLVNIIDWHDTAGYSFDNVNSDLDVILVSSPIDNHIIHPYPNPITTISADDYETLRSYLNEKNNSPAKEGPQSNDLDYWDKLEVKRGRLKDFLDDPSDNAIRDVFDPDYFSTQRSYTFESDYERILEHSDPESIAEVIKSDSPGKLVEEIYGVSWKKASELLRLHKPDNYAMYTPRSKAGMKALGYSVPDIDTESEYLQFIEDVKEAIEQYDLPDVAADVSDDSIPDWATDLDKADYLFSRHYDDDYDFELPPSGICAGELPSAPYYWVNQTNSPEEIENEYLEAKPDGRPGHDLSRLDEGDTVFHFTEGEIIGCSEVTKTAEPAVKEDGLACRVNLSLTEFNPSLVFADVFEYLFQPNVQLDEYYPINHSGVNQGYLFNLSWEAGDYLLEQAGKLESPDHPTFQHYQDTDSCNVWRFTASPTTLLSVLRRGTLPFSDGTAGTPDQRDQWIATEPGDLVILHVAPEEEQIDLESNPENGIIGAAIVGQRDQKSERWCYEEDTELRYPYLINLDELYVTSDLDQIRFDKPLFSLGHTEISAEIDALLADCVPWSVVSDLAQERLNQKLSRNGGNYTNLSKNHNDIASLLRPLFRDLSPRLQEVTPADDLPGMLAPPAEPPRETYRDELKTELERTGQIVLYGPPGTGKTFTATRFARWWIHNQTDRPKETRFRMVTFHPSFSYEDFIEGLTAEAAGDGQVEYTYKDGSFKQIVNEAKSAYIEANDPDDAPRYILLIDEINRGNLSQIFGEAITQLEMDKRIGQSDTVTVQLAHSGESIALPPNLYVIGTMNTADRSIALVDAALRRRFGFLSFPPEYDVFVGAYDFESMQGIYDLAEEVISTSRGQAGSSSPDYYPLLALSIRALQAINENIVEQSDLTKGKRIGHSYLLGIESETELVATWQHDILPLLEEYYFGDFNRLRKEVFNVDLTAETTIDSRLFDQANHEIARIDADDLEKALSSFVDQHDFT